MRQIGYLDDWKEGVFVAAVNPREVPTGWLERSIHYSKYPHLVSRGSASVVLRLVGKNGFVDLTDDTGATKGLGQSVSIEVVLAEQAAVMVEGDDGP